MGIIPLESSLLAPFVLEDQVVLGPVPIPFPALVEPTVWTVQSTALSVTLATNVLIQLVSLLVNKQSKLVSITTPPNWY